MTLQELKIAISKLSPRQLESLDVWFQSYLQEHGGHKESEYLMSSEANRRPLAASQREIEEGNLIDKTLEELEALAPMREARGFLKGIDTTVEREPDREL